MITYNASDFLWIDTSNEAKIVGLVRQLSTVGQHLLNFKLFIPFEQINSNVAIVFYTLIEINISFSKTKWPFP